MAGACKDRRVDAILRLVASGKTDKEIARLLGISIPTVRTHLQRFYRSHRLHSRTEAALYWITFGRPSRQQAEVQPRR